MANLTSARSSSLPRERRVPPVSAAFFVTTENFVIG